MNDQLPHFAPYGRLAVKFRDSHPLTEEQIALIEAENGWVFPQAYRDFLTHHNGGAPAVDTCAVDDNEDCDITGFIPADRIKEEACYIENLPENTIPIAWAECGNYVVLDIHEPGIVRFWDHEDPTRDVILADTFSNFIGALRETSSIEVDKAEVVSVWIDPEFAKSLK